MAEYALLAGFLAVTAGATLPGISQDIEQIFRRTSKIVQLAADGTRNSPTGSFLNP
jgi:Flp pilus assembly pilin Flp